MDVKKRRLAPTTVFLFILGMAHGAFAVEVPLTVKNAEPIEKLSEPVTSGVPFAEGVLSDSSKISIYDSRHALIPAQFLVTARWPDNSIRWILSDFQADLAPSGSLDVVVRTGVEPSPIHGITIENLADTIRVQTGAADFVFSKSELRLLGNAFTAVHMGEVYTAIPASSSSWALEENGPMKTVIRIDGRFRNSSNGLLRDELIGFRCRLFFYRNKEYVRGSFTFRNNNSFGWDYGLNKKPRLEITCLRLGRTQLLPDGGSYVFDGGIERTFDVEVASGGSVASCDARYNPDGSLASSFRAAPPLGLARPSYYESVRAWGRVPAPVTGQAEELQTDMDRFEKFHRAMVSSSDVENPTNNNGITAFGHLFPHIGNWHDYGDLSWAGGWSGNHYDWSYSMYLHAMRTGLMGFANLARVMARHEIDMDIYHTTKDGDAYNLQKNWESRPSHDSPDNLFGCGRPSHNWSQGYALHWLLTGDPRGRDGFEEILEGMRRYVYESFNTNGYCDGHEIRINGWIVENLVNLWRIDPNAVWHTSEYGLKTLPQAIKDVLQNVFDRELASGKQGFVYSLDNRIEPLMICYFLEPVIKAHEEVFEGRDNAYAQELLGLIKRMTSYLMAITRGGDYNAQGLYRPRQIPYFIDKGGISYECQTPYAIMAASAAAYCHLKQGGAQYLDYAKLAFSDFIRYFGVTGGYDQYVDPRERTPTCYNTNVYVDTESKVHGWANRYGNYFLAALPRSCPDCGEDTVTLQDMRFASGMNCTCKAGTSIVLGPHVTIERGAWLTLEAPKIELRPGVFIESGATVTMREQ